MKKNLITRILALLFAVLMLVSVVACTKNPDDPKESDKPAQTDPDPSGSESESVTESDDYKAEGYYNGSTFTVLAYDSIQKYEWNTVPYDIYIAENDGEILSSAVYQRGVILKDQLGVQLEVQSWTGGLSNELKRDIADGEYRYQLVVQQTLAIATLVSNASIASVNSTGIDISKPWFDAQTTELLTVKGKTVAVSSDMTFVDKLCTVGVFFNKQMASDNELGDLYSIVNNKEWNLTKMLEMCETVVPSVDADGVYNLDDTYGISCQNDGGYFFYHASGLTSTSGNADGGLSFTFNSEESVNVLEDVLALTSNKRIYLNRQSADTKIENTAGVAEHFASDKALFLVRPLQALFDLSQYTDNYGIIPMPMVSETQEEYYAPVNTHASVHMCFPNMSTNPAMTKDVVSWLGSYSRKNIVPILYEVVLGSRMTQDKDSPKMLDIIFAGRIYDLGYIWDVTNVRSILTTNIGAGIMKPGTIKTTIDRHVIPIGLRIDQLVADLGGLQ